MRKTSRIRVCRCYAAFCFAYVGEVPASQPGFDTIPDSYVQAQQIWY